MTYRAASTNAHAPSSAAKNRATINTAAARTDVLLVQEADSEVIAAMRALRGFTVYVPKGLGVRNPIAWRSGQFELVTSGWSRIMANKPGVKDGPDRSMVWVVLREIATGKTVVHINAHLIHQAFTSHKERRPSWYASLAVLGAKAAVLLARHRCPVILNADWNNPGKFDIPSIDEREVPSPPTFVSRRYDRFFIVGKATASKVQRIVTPSDHRTLVATIVLGPTLPTVPKPEPVPPKEAPMGRMPGAKWIGEHGSRTMSKVDIVCVHTIVGYAPATAAHFSTHADGRIDQSRSTRYRSAANLNGNHRIIAIENEDHGPRFGKWSGSDVPPLTDEQIDANARILAWAHKEHGVPLQLCPDSRPGSRGLAYHRQGIDGNFGSYDFPGRVSGGEVWTEARGKVCPGDRRIAQLPEILRRAKALVNGEDDDMPYTDWPKKDRDALAKDVRDALLKALFPGGSPKDPTLILTPDAPRRFDSILRNIHENTRPDKGGHK